MHIGKAVAFLALVLGLATVASADSFTLVDSYSGQSAIALIPPLAVSGTVTSVQFTISGMLTATIDTTQMVPYIVTLDQQFTGPITFSNDPMFMFLGVGDGSSTVLTSNYSYSFTISAAPAVVTSSGPFVGPVVAFGSIPSLTLGGLEGIALSLGEDNGGPAGFLTDSGSITEVVNFTPTGGEPMPEPPAYSLLAVGLAGLVSLRAALART